MRGITLGKSMFCGLTAAWALSSCMSPDFAYNKAAEKARAAQRQEWYLMQQCPESEIAKAVKPQGTLHNKVNGKDVYYAIPKDSNRYVNQNVKLPGGIMANAHKQGQNEIQKVQTDYIRSVAATELYYQNLINATTDINRRIDLQNQRSNALNDIRANYQILNTAAYQDYNKIMRKGAKNARKAQREGQIRGAFVNRSGSRKK